MKCLRGISGWLLVVAACTAVVAQESARPILETNFASNGIRRYTPGKWGTIDLVLNNGTNAPLAGTADIFTANDLRMQFARRFWVPARSQRHLWVPVKMPGPMPREVRHVDLRGRVFLDSDDGDQLVRGAGEQMLQSPLAIIDHEHIKTALILPKSRLDLPAAVEFRTDKAHELVIKARKAFGLSETTISVHDDFLPPEAFLMEGADQIVLATDRIVEDTVGLRSLRRWVAGGGQLWIMLDMVNRDTVKELLGTGFDIEYVDRVDLNQVQWEYGEPASKFDTSKPKDFEYAVEMVRVTTDIPRVIHRVEGWPASFLMPYGDGTVLFTTLEARAWLELTNGSVVPELYYLIGTVLKPRPPPRVSAVEMQPELEELIGYQIPRRRTVLLLLGSACLTMVVVASLVWYRRRMEWFALAGPVIALVTAAIFFVMGSSYKHQVNSAIVGVQLTTYSPESREVSVHGGTAIYVPDTDSVPLSGQQGGLVWPQMAGLEGTNKRLLWNDLDDWVWRDLRLPAGVRPAAVEAQISLPDPVAVTGHFGPQGFQGQLASGQLSDVGDAIIAMPPSQRVGVRLEEGGRFVITDRDTLARDQFTLDSLLSDEQRRRREIYQKFVTSKAENQFPTRPTFLCWTSALDFGIQAPEALERRGSALMSLPLVIEPTPPNTSFFVPSAFMKISLKTDVEGRSAVYNPRVGEWTPNVTSVTRTRLHFQLPSQVLPAALERGQLSLKLNAPSRDVQIVLRRGEQDLELRTVRDANGVYTIPIDQADQLVIDSDNGVGVGLFVGRQRGMEAVTNPKTASGSTRVTGWTVEYVRLDLWGHTREPARGSQAAAGPAATSTVTSVP